MLPVELPPPPGDVWLPSRWSRDYVTPLQVEPGLRDIPPVDPEILIELAARQCVTSLQWSQEWLPSRSQECRSSSWEPCVTPLQKPGILEPLLVGAAFLRLTGSLCLGSGRVPRSYGSASPPLLPHSRVSFAFALRLRSQALSASPPGEYSVLNSSSKFCVPDPSLIFSVRRSAILSTTALRTSVSSARK